MLKNLRIFTKLLLAPAMVLFLLICVALVAGVGLKKQKVAMDEIQEVRLKALATASSAATEMYGVQANSYKLLNWYTAGVAQSRIQETYKQQQTICDKVHENLQALAKAEGESSEEGKLSSAAAKVVAEYKKNLDEMMDLASADVNTATMFMTNLEIKYDSLRTVLGKLVVLENTMTNETADAAGKSADRVVLIVAVVTLAAVGFSLLITVLLARTVSGAIYKVKGAAESMADGNLDITLNIEAKDEVGKLSRSMSSMVEKLRQVIGKMKGGVTELTGSAHLLGQLSNEVSAATNNAAQSSMAVAAATEETSAMVSTIAHAVESSSSNVNAIATAIEEMSATVNEVAKNAANTREMADSAAIDADRIAVGVNELSSASIEIGRVTDTITDISEQTKLLALNATIEAARAGDAGKGFAVVAAEIKELARQTNMATTEIGSKVEKIQSSTVTTVEGIHSIVQSIRRMQEATTTIAASIEQQSATTREIAMNIAETSDGFREVSTSTAQMSDSMATIAGDITNISGIMETLSRTVNGLEDSSDNMRKLAQEMDNMAGWFRL